MASKRLPSKLSSLLVTVPNLSAAAQAKLGQTFAHVHSHPGGEGLTADVLAEVDMAFTTNRALADHVRDFKEETPKLELVHLCSSGADKAIASAAFANQVAHPPADPSKAVTLCSASGIHVLSIPNYIIGTWLASFHRLPKQLHFAKVEQRWATGEEVAGGPPARYYARSTRGLTVGFLGYGHLARDTARLMVPFGVKIIAANSDGKRKRDLGFVYPGTGDVEAALPEAFYSTSSDDDLQTFLQRSDILVCSLPSTKQTAGLLTRHRLECLPRDALVVNVGRGDLFQSDDLLHVLDRPGGLWGAVLDVTQPEPLPKGHPLWSHDKVIVTPHLSGDSENEMDLAVDILLENVRRWEAGEPLASEVNVTKGY